MEQPREEVEGHHRQEESCPGTRWGGVRRRAWRRDTRDPLRALGQQDKDALVSDKDVRPANECGNKRPDATSRVVTGPSTVGTVCRDRAGLEAQRPCVVCMPGSWLTSRAG